MLGRCVKAEKPDETTSGRAHHDRRAGGARCARARAARGRGAGRACAGHSLLHVARDDRRLDALETRARASSRPQLRVVSFPAWDTVPYDRVGPELRDRRPPHRGARRLALGARKRADDRADHRQRGAAARAAARRSSRSAMQAARRRPARRHEPADRSGSRSRATCAPAPSWSRASTPCAAASSISSRRGARAPCGSTSSATRWKASRPSTPRPSARRKPVQKLVLMPVSEVAFGDGGRRRCSARATWSCSAAPRATIRSTRRSAPASAIPARSTGCRCSTSTSRRCSTTCRARR